MSDLRTLHDAFAELERRADAAAGTAPITRPRRSTRLVPVAATVVAVAGLAAGVVWLAPGGQGTPAAGPPATSVTTTSRTPVPSSPAELTARFREVLGGTATIEVTQEHTLPGGPASSKNNAPPGSGPVVVPTSNPGFPSTALIAGTLTSGGVTGSFSLTIFPGDSGPESWCRHPRSADCTVSTLPDGSRLATETVRAAPGAVAHLASLHRPDSTTVVLSVGNQEDPRGAALNTPGGRIYSPQSPWELEQLTAIVTSDRW